MKYNIDYINTHFATSVLNKIHGEPSLHDFKKQLKGNTAQVISDLGGSSNRSFGLVLTAAELTQFTSLHILNQFIQEI